MGIGLKLPDSRKSPRSGMGALGFEDYVLLLPKLARQEETTNFWITTKETLWGQPTYIMKYLPRVFKS